MIMDNVQIRQSGDVFMDTMDMIWIGYSHLTIINGI